MLEALAVLILVALIAPGLLRAVCGVAGLLVLAAMPRACSVG